MTLVTDQNTFQGVFEKYGMSLNPQDTVKSLGIRQDPEINLASFASEFFSNNVPDDDDYSGKQYLKDFLGSIITNRHRCSIIDFEQWVSAFRIDKSKLPFPEEYLIKFTFLFFEPEGSYSGLVVPYSGAMDLSKHLNVSPEKILSDLIPSYRLTNLFGSENESYKKGNRELNEKIEELDNLLDPKCVEQLKTDLYNLAVDKMKTILSTS